MFIRGLASSQSVTTERSELALQNGTDFLYAIIRDLWRDLGKRGENLGTGTHQSHLAVVAEA